MHYKDIFNRNWSEDITILHAPTDIERENFDHTWDFPFTFFVLTFVPLHETGFSYKIWQLHNFSVILVCIYFFRTAYLLCYIRSHIYKIDVVWIKESLINGKIVGYELPIASTDNLIKNMTGSIDSIKLTKNKILYDFKFLSSI